MLGVYLERFPVRPRTIMTEYARPRLIDWRLPVADTVVDLQIMKEQQFELLTELQMKSRCGDLGFVLFARVPFALSSVHRWSVILNDRHVSAGITDCDGVADPNSTWIELNEHWNYMGLMARNRDGTEKRWIGPTAPRIPGNIFGSSRTLDFAADLSSNLFTLSIAPFVLSGHVVDLAAYRPFIYCSLRGSDHPWIRFIEPPD